MKGLPLACFSNPNFEDDGLEFFVCNGGGGIAGVRKKEDRTHTVWVRDFNIASNLNMQWARTRCQGGRFSTGMTPSGTFYFLCDGKAIDGEDRFKQGSKADWKKWDAHLK